VIDRDRASSVCRFQDHPEEPSYGRLRIWLFDSELNILNDAAHEVGSSLKTLCLVCSGDHYRELWPNMVGLKDLDSLYVSYILQLIHGRCFRWSTCQNHHQHLYDFDSKLSLCLACVRDLTYCIECSDSGNLFLHDHPSCWSQECFVVLRRPQQRIPGLGSTLWRFNHPYANPSMPRATTRF
jgi:hypothetical protein